MGGIKAGTAYVAVKLSAVQGLRKQLAAEVTAAASSAGRRASKKLGDELDGRPAGRKFKSTFVRGLAGIGAATATAVSGVGTALAATTRGILATGKHLEAFSRQVGMLAYQAQYAGLMLSLAFTAPVVGIGVAGAAIGVKFAMQVEDATIALKALLPAGYDVAALIKRLQQMAIASPVFDSAAVITFTQRMVAAGVEIGKTERFLKAFGNVAVTAGVPMEKVTLALEAVTQIAGPIAQKRLNTPAGGSTQRGFSTKKIRGGS